MAFESKYWKNIIKRDIAYIKKIIAKNVDTYKNDDKLEEAFSKVEIKIFNIAYALRKLSDTRKVSDKLANSSYKIDSYPKTKKRITHMNNHRLDEHYDFSKKIELEMKIRDICNKIIHSYIFQLIISRKKFTYIDFTSDHTKSKYLLSFKINRFLQVAEKFANSYPSKSTMIFDAKIGDYRITME